jgi:hypothetical protein
MGSSASTRNFGFRRFTNIVREGRLRSPSAVELRLGTFVEQDPADPERVREATANAIGAVGADVSSANCGILWYEHDSQTYNSPAFGGAAGLLAVDLDTAPVNRMVQVIQGKGTKVWFRNTGDSETEPGLHFPSFRGAVTIVNGLGSGGVSEGDLLGWDDTNDYWDVTADPAEGFLLVTAVDDTLAKLDAVIVV